MILDSLVFRFVIKSTHRSLKLTQLNLEISFKDVYKRIQEQDPLLKKFWKFQSSIKCSEYISIMIMQSKKITVVNYISQSKAFFLDDA